MTAVIAASASGHLAPLFIIAAGGYVMESWLKPLDKKVFVNEATGPHWLTNTEWLASDVSICCMKN